MSLDPCAGEPLQYAARDGEYLVYGVGHNRIDEGGLVLRKACELQLSGVILVVHSSEQRQYRPPTAGGIFMASALQGLIGRLGVWGMVFLGLGLVLMLLVVLLVGRWFQASRLAEAELARIREAGEPVTPDDLKECCSVGPEEEDTTDLWLQGVGALETAEFQSDARPLPVVGESRAEIPLPGEPWAQLEAAEKLLAKYGRGLDLLHQAADQGGAARYRFDLIPLDPKLLDQVQSLRGGARLLTLEANVRAHRGDLHGAADSIHAMNRLARSLEREPWMMPQLVRVAIAGQARDHLRRLLGSVDLADADLDRLQQDLRASDAKETLRLGMLGERVAGIQQFDGPGFGGAGGGRLFFQVTQRGSFLEFLQYWDKMIRATEEPWPEALEAFKVAGQQVQAKAQGGVSPARVGRVLTALLVPAVEAFTTATARDAAMNRATDAAIACERYRRRHGKLPRSLEELVPEFLPQVPGDPFDGKPLRYVVTQDGYLVYSVGPDGTDDGGQADETSQPDFVFRVERR